MEILQSQGAFGNPRRENLLIDRSPERGPPAPTENVQQSLGRERTIVAHGSRKHIFGDEVTYLEDTSEDLVERCQGSGGRSLCLALGTSEGSHFERGLNLALAGLNVAGWVGNTGVHKDLGDFGGDPAKLGFQGVELIQGMEHVFERNRALVVLFRVGSSESEVDLEFDGSAVLLERNTGSKHFIEVLAQARSFGSVVVLGYHHGTLAQCQGKISKSSHLEQLVDGKVATETIGVRELFEQVHLKVTQNGWLLNSFFRHVMLASNPALKPHHLNDGCRGHFEFADIQQTVKVLQSVVELSEHFERLNFSNDISGNSFVVIVVCYVSKGSFHVLNKVRAILKRGEEVFPVGNDCLVNKALFQFRGGRSLHVRKACRYKFHLLFGKTHPCL